LQGQHRRGHQRDIRAASIKARAGARNGLLPKSRYCQQNYRHQNQIGSHTASTGDVQIHLKRRGLPRLPACCKCSLLASSHCAADNQNVRRFTALSAKQLSFTRGQSSRLVKITAHNLQGSSAVSGGAPGVPARLGDRWTGESLP
jgi:hypothetical protein